MYDRSLVFEFSLCLHFKVVLNGSDGINTLSHVAQNAVKMYEVMRYRNRVALCWDLVRIVNEVNIVCCWPYITTMSRKCDGKRMFGVQCTLWMK